MQAIKCRNQTFCFILVLLASIISCGAGEKSSTTYKEKINVIYKKYLFEKTVCPQFVKVIAKDLEFIENFASVEYREENNINTLLLKSKVAKNNIVQYVIQHSEYFTIDVDYHPSPGLVYVKGSPIFCAHASYKRLEELEKLGPSEKSWKVREDLLNLELESVLEAGMPWHPDWDGHTRYDFLHEEFDRTKKIYTGQVYKQRLINWANKASLLLREKAGYGEDDAAGLTKEQQIKEVERLINDLKKGLE